MFCESVPTFWRVSTPELQGRCTVEVSLGEVVASRLGIGFAQTSGVELLSRRVCCDQACAGAAIALNGRSAALVRNRVAESIRQLLDGLYEADVIHLLQERVHVTTLTAAEAVVEAVVGSHMERRRLLVVKGTQTFDRIATGTLE